MRVKAGVVTRKKHKKILKTTKGYRYSYHKTYKRAHEASMHAGMYSYKHRRKRMHQFRKLWIVRLNAMLRALGYKYSEFISKLKEVGIQINRKILSEMAIHKPEDFKKIVSSVFSK